MENIKQEKALLYAAIDTIITDNAIIDNIIDDENNIPDPKPRTFGFQPPNNGVVPGRFPLKGFPRSFDEYY